MVSARLAMALRLRGYDVESCHEAGRANLHISDPEQLAYATEQGRAILRQNATDVYTLDSRGRPLDAPMREFLSIAQISGRRPARAAAALS